MFRGVLQVIDFSLNKKILQCPVKTMDVTGFTCYSTLIPIGSNTQNVFADIEYYDAVCDPTLFIYIKATMLPLCVPTVR